jgi:hypothetical protein
VPFKAGHPLSIAHSAKGQVASLTTSHALDFAGFLSLVRRILVDNAGDIVFALGQSNPDHLTSDFRSGPKERPTTAGADAFSAWPALGNAAA